MQVTYFLHSHIVCSGSWGHNILRVTFLRWGGAATQWQEEKPDLSSHSPLGHCAKVWHFKGKGTQQSCGLLHCISKVRDSTCPVSIFCTRRSNIKEQIKIFMTGRERESPEEMKKTLHLIPLTTPFSCAYNKEPCIFFLHCIP